MAPKLPTRGPNTALFTPTRIPFNNFFNSVTCPLYLHNTGDTGDNILQMIFDSVSEVFIGNQSVDFVINNYVPMMNNMKGLSPKLFPKYSTNVNVMLHVIDKPTYKRKIVSSLNFEPQGSGRVKSFIILSTENNN
jgi:hypothetical protein